MWSTLLKFGRKVVHYAIIAFSGHEIGTHITNKDSQNPIITIQQTEKSEQNEINIITLCAILVAMVLVALFFVMIKEMLKCVKKSLRKSSNVELTTVPTPTRRVCYFFSKDKVK